ncbi:MAG: transglutaminase-like domain-containing protein [Candidatus Pacearchaeota archaeon]|nr:transglutaminase-like domain-containing protein [Candidatus Pacearchaeota archaeon]
MKKTLFIFWIFMLILSTNSAKASEIRINISGFLEAYKNVEVYVFPRNTTTQIAFLKTIPEAKIEENKIIFEPKKFFFEFQILSNVTTKFNIPKIKKANLTSTIPDYKEETELIDSENLLIKTKAKQFKEKLYSSTQELLHEIAEYIRKNVRYSKEYLQPQRASWILENKVGVCSHYTILFIALCRALNISARYVSGIVYDEEKNEFAEHAWAEVYFDEYGWIPYDITFAQYGWLDSSHVILKYGKDLSEPSVKYLSKKEHEMERLSIEGKILNKSNIEMNFSIKIKPYRTKIGLESYLPLQVEIENNHDFYFSLPIYLTKAPGEQEEVSKVVFLKPKEKRKIFFIIKIPFIENCKEKCIGEIEIRDFFNNLASTSIEISEKHERITQKQAEAISSGEIIDFSCTKDKEYYYKDEQAKIKCFVFLKNKQNFQLCLDTCISLEEQNATLEFVTNSSEIVCVKLKLENTTIENCIRNEIISYPIIQIQNIKTTQTTYGNPLEIEVNFYSNIEEKGKLILRQNKKKIEEYEININRGKNFILLNADSTKLKEGFNNLEIIILHKNYTSRKLVSFYIKKTSFTRKILIYLKKFAESF